MRQKESAPLLFFVTDTKATADCAAARQQEPSIVKGRKSKVKYGKEREARLRVPEQTAKTSGREDSRGEME